LPQIEADLSKSSTLSVAHTSFTQRSLEPIVRLLTQLVLLRIKLNPEIKAAAIAEYISPFNNGVNK